jgi:hypothetical protein
MAEGAANGETQVPSVRVYEHWRYTPIAPMAMNKDKFRFTHLPSLLDNVVQHITVSNVMGMVAVKINFQCVPPSGVLLDDPPSVSHRGRSNIFFRSERPEPSNSALKSRPPLRKIVAKIVWPT